MRASLKFLILIPSVLAIFSSNGQNRPSFQEFNAERQKRFDAFKEQKQKEFDEFRRKRNEEFAKYIREGWVRVDVKPVLPAPKDDVVPPVVKPKDDVRPTEPVPVPFDEIIPAPKPVPQPEPVDPIFEISEDTPPVTPGPVDPIKEEVPKPKFRHVDFSFFGTPVSVRIDEKARLKLTAIDENSIADAWLALSEDSYTNTVYDCLKLRDDLRLDDWPYLMLLRSMGEAVCGKGTNEATLLMAYVYCQSGYRMRLASSGTKLHMLYASNHVIYDLPYFTVAGENYYLFGKGPSQLHICNQVYPKEKSMSLLMNRQPALAMRPERASVHTSTRNADMTTTTRANGNMLEFYNSYPSSKVNDNIMTRWAMYANMPMPDYIRSELYPVIKKNIEGLDQWEALNKILHWVQTGFKYEYDDKVWGRDRAFFPEESLHYQYCDCEDRSIMLTRIVRDILGLQCVLVYYPGHLAAAVAVNEDDDPTGDYFKYQGKRFFIADGTIMGYGASVGETMIGMNNAEAKLILLD